MNSKLIVALALILAVNSAAAVEVPKWTYNDGNITCLIVQMNIQVNFTYKAMDNSSKVALYQVPANVTSVDKTGSKCSETEDTLKVSWDAGNNFILNFASNASKYDLASFVITLNTTSLFNDSAVNQTIQVTYKLQNESFDIPYKFSYHCNDDQRLNGTDDSSYIVVSQVQFEAFRTSDTNEFAGAKDCKSNITPDIVPIAVGISLIALIVVVLIAYIVGRRRQQARGYLNIM